MNANDQVILILKSLAANYPILRSWGFIFPRLITIVTSTESMARLMEILINFPENRNNSTQIRNSDFAFHLLGNGKKKQPDLDAIYIKNQLDFKGNQGLPVLITENSIVDEFDTNRFYVFLDEDILQKNIRIDELVPDARELEIVYKRILKLKEDAFSQEEEILRAAACFLEPYLYRAGLQIKTDELLDVVHGLCVLDEDARDTKDLDNLFVKTLYAWQAKNDFGEIFELVGGNFNMEEIQNLILFDEAFVYMGEKLFKKIVEPLMTYIPVNSLKKGLFDAGIIDTGSESATTYTVKVGLWLDSTGYKRVRMLRFRRDKLDMPGEIGFVDLCCMAKEGGVE